MPRYRVRDGQQLGINDGEPRTLNAGDMLDLPLHIAREVMERIEPCDESGDSLAALSSDDLELAQALPHERASLLAMQAARVAPVASVEPAPSAVAVAPPPQPVVTTFVRPQPNAPAVSGAE